MLGSSRRRAGLPAVVLLALALPPGCGGKRDTPTESAAAPSARAVISVDHVEARAMPSGKAAVSTVLRRGTEVGIRESQGDFWRVSIASGGEAWVPSGCFERLSEKAAREARASKVRTFPPQPGRAVEPCPILLAPEYGAARWGDLEDGGDVDVLLADHDFYGVVLADKSLAFVPARSIRLLASPNPPDAPPPEGRPTRHQPVPMVTSLDEAGAEPVPAALSPDTSVAATQAPLESLPPGGEPAEIETRVEPRYPEAARQARVGGDVVLKIVVEASGAVGRIDVISGAPYGLTEAAVDAVRRWKYKPARVGGREVAAFKVVAVKFTTGRDRGR